MQKMPPAIFTEENVISLNSWKEHFNLEKEKTNSKIVVSEYLTQLSFNQLIAEATETLLFIKNNKLNPQMINHSKLLLKEFNRRIDSMSIMLSDSLKEIRQKVENKIKELEEVPRY